MDCLWQQPKVVSGYAQKFKMAEPSDNPCSSECSSEDDENSDALDDLDACFVPIQSRGYRNRKPI